MKKILIAIIAIIVAASFCYAANEPTPKATSPLGAVVETGGVLVGKLTNVIEKSLGGGKMENSLVMAEDNGKTKIIPLDNTVKALDTGFHVVTLNQLKGRKVSVSTAGGRATTVQEIK
ncbi:MAG: hypothetical protein NTW09_05570 [Candidatus Omnitrophica bacterium]|nr:hypothetical protein [Candidatus Omnitrophota bacterium]